MTSEQISTAVDFLKQGKVIIFPTETVMGIGCSINSSEGIERVYSIKGRDKSQPTHVLVDSLDMATSYADFSPLALQLAKNFWPGPLTIVAPLKSIQIENLSRIANDENKLGFRISPLKEIGEIITQLGTPILCPSANKKGEKPPSSLQEIDKDILSLVDYVIDSASGGEMPSTIVEVDENSIKVIREGPITKEKINSVLKEHGNEQV